MSYRGRMIEAISAAMEPPPADMPDEQGRTERLSALLLVSASVYAAQNDMPCEPVMFAQMATAALDAMDNFRESQSGN